jgi:biofilm PGA synthesis N-glycosyltransferase PgaC
MEVKKLLVISPCRDEIDFALETLESIVNQSVKPDLWIIVDDGSTDGTSELLKEYAERYSFIRVHTRINRGERSVGPGVVEAFYDGLSLVPLDEYEYVCKLDLDLRIPNQYFETVLNEFGSETNLGTYSGKPYSIRNGKRTMEPTGDDFSVGMIKMYRVSAFKDIGGFARGVMWDGIDCHMCRFKGWKAKSSNEEKLQFDHLRVMGSSQKSIYVGKRRHGYGQYYMGSSLIYFFVSCVYRVFEYPMLGGVINSMYGYLVPFFKQRERFGTRKFQKFLKTYQWKVLFTGRQAAMIWAQNSWRKDD